MSSKNEQKIKFEADVTGFNKNIAEAGKTITNLNNKLKLNQEQLKGTTENANLLSEKIELLKKKQEEETKIIDNNKSKLKVLTEEYEKQTKKTEELKQKYNETAESMR